MPSQNTPGDIRAEVFETRIALSFFGGVSLAVYESGMAVEFFRLVPATAFTGNCTSKSAR